MRKISVFLLLALLLSLSACTVRQSPAPSAQPTASPVEELAEPETSVSNAEPESEETALPMGTGALVINEVCSSSAESLLPGEEAFYDWVELKNIGSESLELGEYSLSDREDRPHSFDLPQQTLGSGELLLLLCTDEVESAGGYVSTQFKLSEGESILLFRNGEYADGLELRRSTYGGSQGRMNGVESFVFLAAATPGAENSGAYGTAISEAVSFSAPGGVFVPGESVTVSLSGSGELRYTLDGSLPDGSSSLYEAPLKLTESCVLRAVSIESGKLPSEAATAHYIFEDEPLDVVSVAAEPEAFADFYGGVDKSIEMPVHMALLGENGFSAECGIAFHGNSEITASGKQKSLMLRFRGRYGSGDLRCDPFGEGEEVLSSLVLRTGISREYYFLADPIYTSLARECYPELESTRCRFVSLYVNGRYMGLFQLRDRFSRSYFAEKWGVKKESVEIISIAEANNTALGEDMAWLISHDLSVPENAETAAKLFDLHTLAEWFIIESYCVNTDIRLNVKFARSPFHNEGRWEVLLFDLDRALLMDIPVDNLYSHSEGVNPDFPQMFAALRSCAPFRSELLCALSEGRSTLTTEHTLARTDEIRDSVNGQMLRSLNRWEYELPRYEAGIAQLRSRMELWNIPQLMRRSAVTHFTFTQEEQDQYLGDWGK